MMKFLFWTTILLVINSVSADGSAIVNAAREMLGRSDTSYVWGGGNVNGPSTGIDYSGCSFSTMTGFDCSGLALYAVYKGTGKTLPHSAKQQYTKTDIGTRIPVDEIQPGDLIFYGSSEASIYHVAVYSGNNKMIEATNFDETTCVGQPMAENNKRTSNLISYGMRFWEPDQQQQSSSVQNQNSNSVAESSSHNSASYVSVLPFISLLLSFVLILL